MKERQVVNILPRHVQDEIKQRKVMFNELQEIRMRTGKPLLVTCKGKEVICSLIITEKDIQESLDYVSNYSLYAYENEVRQGFITVEGGHRVGLAGQVLLEQGQVKNMKQISSLNIRVSHEIIGCATPLFPYITKQGRLCHTMIISPPRCGKTTVLRDAIRQISDGNRWMKGCTVGVVDERSEIAGCYRGIPQNDVGMRTDVLDGCPKAEGMMILVRSMAPQVIAVDEIGAMGEIEAIRYAMNCGCRLLATVHGEDIEEIKRKPLFQEWMREQSIERYVLLNHETGIGKMDAVFDAKGNPIWLSGSVVS